MTDEIIDPDFEEMRALLAASSVDPVPQEISRRQFFQVLANREMITKAEALEAVTLGALPAAIETILAAIVDENIEWSARMSFTAQIFDRSNWCVDMFGAMQGMSSAEINQLWRDGAVLD